MATPGPHLSPAAISAASGLLALLSEVPWGWILDLPCFLAFVDAAFAPPSLLAGPGCRRGNEPVAWAALLLPGRPCQVPRVRSVVGERRGVG